MEANRALSANSPEIMDLVQKFEGFDPCEEANVVYSNVTEQLAEHSLLDHLSTVPEGHGGGISLSLTGMRLNTVADIIFQNVRVSRNEALVGGEFIPRAGIANYVLWRRWTIGDLHQSALE